MATHSSIPAWRIPWAEELAGYCPYLCKELDMTEVTQYAQSHQLMLLLLLFGTIKHDQCKEIEENNKMGKTRDLFKKIRDIKGTFHAKMGSIKDRDGMDLTKAEDTKKRWQDYTEKLYKKDLYDPDNHYG